MFNQKSSASESLVSPEIQLLGFALIPIIAMGYDVLIARNINNLHRLGTFIRNEIEPIYLNKQPSYLLIMVILFALHAFVFSFMRQQILKFDIFEDG